MIISNFDNKSKIATHGLMINSNQNSVYKRNTLQLTPIKAGNARMFSPPAVKGKILLSPLNSHQKMKPVNKNISSFNTT